MSTTTWTRNGIHLTLSSNQMSDGTSLIKLEEQTRVHPLPDMFFGGSCVTFRMHGSTLEFNPVDAMKCSYVLTPPFASELWDNINAPTTSSPTSRAEWANKLQVRQSSTWRALQNHPDVRELIYNHDWTYTSTYWGTTIGFSGSSVLVGEQCSDDFFPFELLTDTSLKILLFKEVHFWDDELDDNGMSRMTVKVRVMDSFFFVLMKYELRVDGVLESRSLETRIFHAFGSDHIKREFRWI